MTLFFTNKVKNFTQIKVLCIFVYIMTKAQDSKVLARYVQIAEVMGKMFAPFLEALVHDLRKPEASVMAIYNAHVTGRKLGDPATNLSLKRLSGDVPDELINYENEGPDGREMKSSAISIRNDKDKIIGVLSLNMDVSFFKQFQLSLSMLLESTPLGLELDEGREQFFPGSPKKEIQHAIQKLLTAKGWVTKTMSSAQKRVIVQDLFKMGELNKRGAVTIISNELGISRPSVYNYIRVVMTD
jgi:predicted transcriptional regulator YheO